MLEKGEPRTNIRIVAQGLVKNQNFIKRYERLDAKLGNCIFMLQQVSSTETLTNVMKEMGKIFKTSENFNPKEVQKTVM